MPQKNKTKKALFEGNLARRIFFICLAFLIIPLFVHSFLLYHHEIRIEEKNIRSDLRAIGAQMAENLSLRIHADWEKLGDSPRTAQIDNNVLILGGTTRRPLSTLLSLPEPASFPIEATFDSLPKNHWQEQFAILDTNLTLTIGTAQNHITDLQTSHLIFRVGSFLFLVAILGGAAVYFLVRKAYRPLNALRLTMERVAEGAIHSRYAPHRYGFEINALGECFNTTLDSVLFHQRQAEEAKLHREKLAQELRLGHEIQESLLPTEFPHLPHLSIGASSKSAQEVGGDFYDIFPLSSSKCLITIADLAGKGISACLFSLGLRSSLRALATTTTDLSQIVEQANELFLLDAKERGEFATLWIGILESNTLQYLCLGHPPTLLKRQGSIVELSTGHASLGLMSLRGLTPSIQAIEPGNALLLYSDGITEAHNPVGELYGMTRLKSSFLRVQNSSAQDNAEHILQDVERFSKAAPQHDDLTLLLIQVSQ